MTDAPTRTVHVLIAGRVQGVGFRYWLCDEAMALGLAGWVRNRDDGRVEAVIAGAPATVDALLARCRRGPAAARVDDVAIEESGAAAPQPFEIRPTA
jgi:acylphosphatase